MDATIIRVWRRGIARCAVMNLILDGRKKAHAKELIAEAKRIKALSTKHYIKKRMGFKSKDWVPDELIELKKLELKFKRKTKKTKT